MPDETYWESLFDVPVILDCLGIDGRLGDVIELGCGYGTFTIPVAQRTSGVIDTFDIEPQMVARTRERASEAGLHNVRCHQRDVLVQGFGVPDESRDACLLFNILHGQESVPLLREAARVVKCGGSVHIIHWRYDPSTPRGPSMDIRPRPEQVIAWAEDACLDASKSSPINLPPWHYGFRFRKPQKRSPV